MTETAEWNTIPAATPEQVAFFQERGYLKLGKIFTAKELDALRDHVAEMIANLPPGKRPEAMDTPHFQDPWLFRYLTHPRVLDVVEQFLGPDVILWSSHFISKPAGDGLAVPWHTDGASWGPRLEPMQVMTLWLAVDESVLENGCMRVISGSHREVAAAMNRYEQVDRDSHVFGFRLPEELIDPEKVVNLELQPGEMHLHDAWTIHSSAPNHSAKRRCGYTMRYMPANVKHHPARGHKIYLVRGQDRTDGFNEYEPLPEY